VSQRHRPPILNDTPSPSFLALPWGAPSARLDRGRRRRRGRLLRRLRGRVYFNDGRNWANCLISDISYEGDTTPGRKDELCTLISAADQIDDPAENAAARPCPSKLLVSGLQPRSPVRELFGFYRLRESSDRPILNAFCLVAPSVRFSVRAILTAGVFRRASDFSSRICAGVQARLLDAFLRIRIYDPPNKELITYVVRKC
jgi:hypothetical protein